MRPLRFWLIGLLVALLLLWLLRGMLLPFAAGMIIAYLLDPLVERLARGQVPRVWVCSLVLLSFVGVLAILILMLAPLVQAQVSGFIVALPDYITKVQTLTKPLLRWLMRQLSTADMERLRDAAEQFAGDAVSWAGQIIGDLVSGGVALFDVLSLLFVTPVVAFYLLRDWNKVLTTVDACLPRPHADVIRAQARAVDATLAAFIRGQAMVCLALGIYYALTLSLLGLSFGLVIGLLIGVLSFIPFVGALVGFVVAVGLAIVQFYDIWMTGAVVVVFAIGQAVESNYLTPKLVGERIGLHPVWVMFALLAGGALFGFLGILVAMPVAAALGVLIRFAFARYRESVYYHGYHDAS